jgi:hypothetical protein
VGKASRQRWNHDQIPEMGSLDSLSMVFLQREYRVRRRRRTPVLWLSLSIFLLVHLLG